MSSSPATDAELVPLRLTDALIRDGPGTVRRTVGIGWTSAGPPWIGESAAGRGGQGKGYPSPVRARAAAVDRFMHHAHVVVNRELPSDQARDGTLG